MPRRARELWCPQICSQIPCRIQFKPFGLRVETLTTFCSFSWIRVTFSYLRHRVRRLLNLWTVTTSTNWSTLWLSARLRNLPSSTSKSAQRPANQTKLSSSTSSRSTKVAQKALYTLWKWLNQILQITTDLMERESALCTKENSLLRSLMSLW